jgi:hypothetical protein
MAAHATAVTAATGQLAEGDGQMGLYERLPLPRRVLPPRPVARLCAGCRAKEARYGFRQEETLERPNTLCFECFRMEIDRRQRVAAQLARGWNASQVQLPLEGTLHELDLRRRRAQIAARHAIGA